MMIDFEQTMGSIFKEAFDRQARLMRATENLHSVFSPEQVAEIRKSLGKLLKEMK